MTNIALLFLLFIKLSFNAIPIDNTNTAVCADSEEIKLYNLINDYRQEKGLKAIPFSSALTEVAQKHAQDLVENYDLNQDCNPHSWSDQGEWKGCCYSNDHKNPECMWLKPKEISGYQGDGFEIVYFHSNRVEAEAALTSWKKSKGHNPVITNANQWQKATWNAMGVGIYKNYATVWFGMVPDEKGKPAACD